MARITRMEFRGGDHQRGPGNGVRDDEASSARGVDRGLRDEDASRPVPANVRLAQLSLLFSQGPAGIRSKGEAELESFERKAGRASVSSKARVRCSRCRSLNGERARFCAQCGKRLQVPAAPAPGLARATRAAVERDLRAEARRLAEREAIPISEAINRVRSRPRTKAHLTRHEGP